MPLTSEIDDIFEALFGDGTGLTKGLDGKWTFTEVAGLPKLPGEGILTYLARIAQDCIFIRGEWEAGEYLKNQAVAYASSMWIATGTTSGEPGVDAAWIPLFYSLTGLDGAPGRDGTDSIVRAL